MPPRARAATVANPLRFRDHVLARPGTLIMGIVNVTPDSFSDGGRSATVDAAVAHGLALGAEGADILDIGGESTRPGAPTVPADEELARTIPVIEALVARGLAPVSIDTRKPEVAVAALTAGASIVNDVTGFRDPRMIAAVADARAGAIVMHMQGTPETMQTAPAYADVVAEVGAFLVGRGQALADAGVPRDGILLDPGIGFGKTVAHNLEILRRLPELVDRGYPVLVGASRKSFIGRLTAFDGRPPGATDRLEGTLAAHVQAALGGARVVRVHDVSAHRRALAIADAIRLGEVVA